MRIWLHFRIAQLFAGNETWKHDVAMRKLPISIGHFYLRFVKKKLIYESKAIFYADTLEDGTLLGTNRQHGARGRGAAKDKKIGRDNYTS